MDDSLIRGLKVVKNGMFLGQTEQKGNKKVFSPSNSLPLLLSKEMIREDSFLPYNAEDLMLAKYLKGETIPAKEGIKTNGYVVIGVEDYPLGLGKISGGMIKNMYPAAWRME